MRADRLQDEARWTESPADPATTTAGDDLVVAIAVGSNDDGHIYSELRFSSSPSSSISSASSSSSAQGGQKTMS